MSLRLTLSSKPRLSTDGVAVAGKLRSRNSDCTYTRIIARRQRSFCDQTVPGMDNQLLVDLDLQEVTGNVCLDCVLNA